MLHKPAQKRIYFEGATYFTTFNTKNWIKYFDEPIFCEIFIALLRLSRVFYKYNLFSFVVLINHVHLLFFPYEARDMSKIMQFLKRNCSRNINFILGLETEEAIYKSLLRLSGGYNPWKNLLHKILHSPKLNEKFHNPPNKYAQYKELIEEHYNFLKQLRQQFIDKYGNDSNIFPKFHWQKSFHDHYIRNHIDFEAHLKYIADNPFKHQIPNAENYKYIFTNYPEVISEA